MIVGYISNRKVGHHDTDNTTYTLIIQTFFNELAGLLL